jgi:hypothetical protein
MSPHSDISSHRLETKEFGMLSSPNASTKTHHPACPIGRTYIGYAAMLLGVASNIPFTLLTMHFDYPGVLREPAIEVLAAFATGGPGLILTWYAYGLSALAIVPLGLAFAFGWPRWRDTPGLAIGSAIAAGFAGITQAIGLFRWVFVVPSLARIAADPDASVAAKAAAASAFDLMNLFGGVTIGEHVGQVLTCFWVLLVVISQCRRPRRIELAAAFLGILTILGIGIGLGEGLAIALGQDGSLFGIATSLGFMALTLWLIATGLTYILPDRTFVSEH